MARMTRKMLVRDWASRAAWSLSASGTFRMPNDEPSLAGEVCHELRSMYPNTHLTYDVPRFGGKATLLSDDHLGTKKDGEE